jgi:hypothetical protein
MMENNVIKSDLNALIHDLRGHKVMLDYDLAVLYGVETKRLKEQVKRNISRFPADFMFELSLEEFENLRSQIATSRWGGMRYLPMAFTEQGVAMLSSVLNSERAIQINIEIMRAFAKYRAILIENKDLSLEIRSLDEKLNQIFRYLLQKIDELGKKTNQLIDQRLVLKETMKLKGCRTCQWYGISV